ncbi:MAG: hypothetical protein ACQESA_01885 [Patescibacteria group bacterium]
MKNNFEDIFSSIEESGQEDENDPNAAIFENEDEEKDDPYGELEDDYLPEIPDFDE